MTQIKPGNKFFAPCPRGLETVLADELTALGGQLVKATDGGVHFSGEWALCAKANLKSRIASRILWRVTAGRYRSEHDVYDVAFGFDWPMLFGPERTIRVNVAAQKCPLPSLDFVTLKIKDGVCDKFRQERGSRPTVDTANPDIRIHAFLDELNVTLYVDTSGDALFKRGLRQISNEAPLRENLAAGILKLAGWAPGIPLLDPMCGSGTILLEAAQMSLNIDPGSRRSFAFQKLNNYHRGAWEALLAESIAAQKAPEPLPIWGSDLYGDALKAAQHNFEEAGLAGTVHLKQANVLEVSAPAPTGLLVTNPPYGVRLEDAKSLAELYPQLGHLLKQKFAGWNAFFFTGDPQLAKLIRLSTSRRTVLFNGALECRLFEYRMIAGSNRKADDTPSQTGH